ncbi:hypothetical protein [Halorubrum sp. CSM-61]|uniref:hypothetical protein n=1 Tax=Halorubrum sp. CSM-61 TaxID=2485838 RepID=UPI000F4B1EE7|nr:hypothetical protein [Halorubrum sp. CSM-61]
MSTEQQSESNNQLNDRPNFLLENENIILKLSTKSKSVFDSTDMEYYLTDSRVIATTSNLSSNQLSDISLDQIVGVDEKTDNIIVQLITGGSFIVGGIIMSLVVTGSELLGLLSILGGLFIIVASYLQKSTGYVITTPNPDVSIELNVARNSPKTRKFIDRVRKEARRR